MTFDQITYAILAGIAFTSIVYTFTGWRNVVNCYRMWFTKSYWTNYNIIEAASWLAKAVIIVPGLIFGIQIWQLYFVALVTSMTLIWASNKKLLPTLVGFNTLWIWLSCMVLAQYLI
jgi:hypothetical protein